MLLIADSASLLAAGLVLALSLFIGSLAAADPVDALATTVARIEDNLGARVGVALLDTGSGFSWQHRADERFLMNSTVKAPLCGAVLAWADAGGLSLADAVPIREEDLLDYAPVTKSRLGGRMSLAELCLAAVDMSDNTATNLLIDQLGGPQDVTAFFQRIGDEITRLDRREPDLNTFVVGDPRDTTTPAAMARTLQALLLGDVLTAESCEQLAQWMRIGSVTGDLIRSSAAESWTVYDKSGSGSHTRNVIGMIVPQGRHPWLVTLFVSDVDAEFATRDAALQELSTAVVEVIRDHDT